MFFDKSAPHLLHEILLQASLVFLKLLILQISLTFLPLPPLLCLTTPQRLNEGNTHSSFAPPCGTVALCHPFTSSSSTISQFNLALVRLPNFPINFFLHLQRDILHEKKATRHRVNNGAKQTRTQSTEQFAHRLSRTAIAQNFRHQLFSKFSKHRQVDNCNALKRDTKRQVLNLEPTKLKLLGYFLLINISVFDVSVHRH